MKIKFSDNKVLDCSLRLYNGETCSLGENILPDIEREMKHRDNDLYECSSTSDEFVSFYRNECQKASHEPGYNGDVLQGLPRAKIENGWEWVFTAR